MTHPLIARLRLMTRLSEPELTSIVQACSATQSFVAGADIAPQGHQPSGFHIVVEGWAGRYNILTDGRRQFPALCLPGDVCDLDGLLLQRIQSGICALTACKMVVLPHALIRDLMDRNTAIRDAFWWLQSVENAIATEWSVGLGRRSAEEKTAHLLCEILTRLRMVGLSVGDGCAFPLTQAEIGDVLGLSTVHVNRTLTDLRSMGLIDIKGRWLRILDFATLKETGNFDPGYLHLEGLKRSLGPDHLSVHAMSTDLQMPAR